LENGLRKGVVVGSYVSSVETIMTADRIIEDIKLLPRDEQSRVVQFAVELARSRQLPAEDLVVIAQKMLETNNVAEKKRLEDELTCGFYGD
jgi:isocitrate/isopropylmalate dehydrogenase